MNFVVKAGCELLKPDGSIWARAGDVVCIPVDSGIPEERTQAQKDLRGQHQKLDAAPDAPTAKRQDRSMDAPIKKSKGRRKKD